MNFKEFLQESEKTQANVHMEHLQDNVLNRGVIGARQAINFLQSLRDMLAGKSQSKVVVTTKFDGAPAVICGINPDNGKFFVGTKSVFNKDGKLNYTNEDIDKNHPGEGLNKKLKIALAYLPKLNIKGIYQGDMMFTKGDLKFEDIDEEKYVTFRPNTITYAVPADSKLAKRMMDAQMGIVFHTSYSGQSMDSLRVSFNIDIGRFSSTKDVWFRDASFVDASGTATFTDSETQKLNDILSQAGKVFRMIDPRVLNRISSNQTFLENIKTYNNSKVRKGEKIANTANHVRELNAWLESKLNKSILDAKKEDTKRKRQIEKNEVMRFFRGNANQLKLIFDLMNLIDEAKLMIVKKLEKLKNSIGSFMQTDNGFKVTGPEGFVVVDRLSGGALKMIDQLTFSKNNFTVAKNWSK